MTLMEHLNELRMRLFRAVLAIARRLGGVRLLLRRDRRAADHSFVNAVEKLAAERNIDAKLTFSTWPGRSP
jgi:hypothetical protein